MMTEFGTVVVFYIFHTLVCLSDINIGTHGTPWMCNNDPENTQSITPLSRSDQQLINKLEQVQVLHRHGSRVGSYAISKFLPNTNLEYNCNITSVVTRQYKDNNYYTDSSKPMLNLRKMYVKNEQVTEGNCESEQSLKHLIPQQQANAHHIKKAYIGNETYNLMNNSILQDIANNFIMNSEDKRLKLSSTDFERTIASLSVIASELLFNNIDSNGIIMNADVHDQATDPYYGYDECENGDQFKEWSAMFNSDPLRIPDDDIINSEFANDTISSFIDEGGQWFSKEVGNQLLYPYCNGMTLPLTNSTFWNAVQLSYDIDTAFMNTSYAKNKTECYWNFMNIPMLNKMQNDINMMKQYKYPRLVIHSVHDYTIIRLLLSLGMYDYNLIMFGEFVTLEIYSAKNNTDLYYFRWSRKGKFIPYPTCDYKNGNTELCDLDIMIQRSFQNVVSQDQWLNQCLNVVTNCQCGYCKDDNISTTIMYTTEVDTSTTNKNDDNNNNGNGCSKTSNDVIDAEGSSFWIGIAIGCGIGIILACVGTIVGRRFCCKKERFVHSQYFLEEESYKL